jgi:enhancing lycopene biosynthesis protein 2
MSKKVGVLLSGCGVFDGSEINESVLTMLYLEQAGAEVVCMAPDVPQANVVNHLTGEEMEESRNVLIESARIARGNIKDLKEVEPGALDALILPGGFGAAKNLSTFAFKGPDGQVQSEVDRIIKEMIKANKPIGALCIAPATLAMSLRQYGLELTVGSHEDTIGALQSMGVNHTVCKVNEIKVDKNNKVVTTPAYMLGPGIKEVASGIEKLVWEILTML